MLSGTELNSGFAAKPFMEVTMADNLLTTMVHHLRLFDRCCWLCFSWSFSRASLTCFSPGVSLAGGAPARFFFVSLLSFLSFLSFFSFLSFCDVFDFFDFFDFFLLFLDFFFVLPSPRL